MSSKKMKTKVSQTELRKMMQKMKSSKTEVPSNGSKELNKTSTLLKRKFADQIYHDEKTSKIRKTNSVVDKTLPMKANVKSDLSKDLKPQLKKVFPSKRPLKTTITSSNEFNQPPASKVQKIHKKKLSKSSTPLVSGSYSSSDNSSDEKESSSTSHLSNKPTSNMNEEKLKTKSELQSVLPAGFFDDPEVDAKIRGVETPADKMDREWESFQRELQHEAGQSEQLIEEEHETGHLDREIDEIDEQIQYYTVIDKLHDKKETILDQTNSQNNLENDGNMEVDSSSDEIDEDILDWREKDAFT